MAKNSREVYTFTWTQDGTGYLDIADDIEPSACTVNDPKGLRATTADLAIDVASASKIYLQCDTTDVASSSNFDFKILSSADGVTYETTGEEYFIASLAQAINKVTSSATTPAPQYIKVRLDVNAVNVDAAKDVVLKVFINKR